MAVTVRQSVVSPLGIINQPNRYGVYPPGALAQANNCVLRDPGVLEAAVGVPSFQLLPPEKLVHRMFGGDGQYGFSWVRDETTGQWDIYDYSTNLFTFEDLAIGKVDLFDQFGRLQPARLANRLTMNSLQGNMVVDSMAPSGAPERVIRWASMPQLRIGQPNLTGIGSGTAYASPSTVAYTAIIRRKYADGYEIVSRPAAPRAFRVRLPSTNGNVNVNVSICPSTVSGASRSNVRVGDLVELYRTPSVNGGSLAAVNPGATFYLVSSQVVTSTDITNGRVAMTDHAQAAQAGGSQGGLGKALYTNPGLGGTNNEYLQTPTARCCATFKGYTFWANITEKASWSFGFPAGLGSVGDPGINGVTNNTRSFGIGERLPTGTASLGSPTLTGVSATDMLGIVVGQQFVDDTNSRFDYSSDVLVVSRTASTITVNKNALSAGTTLVTVVDRLSINGMLFAIERPSDFAELLGFNIPNETWETEVNSSLNLYTDSYSLSLAGTNGVQWGLRFRLQPMRYIQGNIFVRATNGANYDPPIPEIGATAQTFTPTVRLNLLQWSAPQQPEAFQFGNETFVGGGEIYALQPTRDALWIFCSDGLYRLSGEAGNWRVDPVDPSLILAAPNASAVLRDCVYAYTGRGLVRVESNGYVSELSSQVVGNDYPGSGWSYSRRTFMGAREDTDEILLNTFQALTATANPSARVLVYNTIQRAFTTMTGFSTATAYVYRRNTTVTSPNGTVLPNPFFTIAFYNTTSLDPTVSNWSERDNPTSLTALIEFQPLYLDNPFSSKQWIDVTLISSLETSNASDPANAPTITMTFGNLVFSSQGAKMLPFRAESRLTFGVPRGAPAIWPTLAPGIFVVSGQYASRIQLRGLSVRANEYSQQQLSKA